MSASEILINCLGGWLCGSRLVAWWGGWLVRWLVGKLVAWLIARCLFAWLVGGWLVGGWLEVWSIS